MRNPFKFAILTALGLLAVNQASANLIINGDFEAGYSGFTSGYNYVAPTGINPMWPEGTFTVHDNINALHSLWTYGPAEDHTSGAGKNMLIVNGDHGATVWSGTLNSALTSGTYTFSAWVANIYPDAPATLEFFVGSTSLGTISLGSAGVWQQFSATFSVPPVSGNPTFADLVFTASGNDFAVDDLSLVAVPEPTTMIAGALLLLPFGVSTIRMLRRKV